MIGARTGSFNEAAGIHRRKLGGLGCKLRTVFGSPNGASMRPPEFTGGNRCSGVKGALPSMAASMRPPEFTGGNGDAGLLDTTLRMLQ